MIAVLLPIVIFVGFYFHRRDVYDLHHAILGIPSISLFFSVFEKVYLIISLLTT